MEYSKILADAEVKTDCLRHIINQCDRYHSEGKGYLNRAIEEAENGKPDEDSWLYSSHKEYEAKAAASERLLEKFNKL